MPTEARVFCSIWSDPAFIELPPGPQRLYLFLFSQPDISIAGVLPLRERYWASRSAGYALAVQRRDLAVLCDRRFVVTDESTEEAMVRSYVRWNRVLRSPKLLKPFDAAARRIASPPIRVALAGEIKRIEADGELHRDAVTGEVSSVLAGMLNALLPLLAPFPQVDTLFDRVSDGVPDTPLGSRNKEELTESGKNLSRARAREAAPGSDADPGFAAFWDAYPRKTAKGEARKAWAKAVKGGADPGVLIAAAVRYRDSPGRKPDYTPHPATWLNQERWGDDPGTVPPPRSQGQAETDALFERAARRIANRKGTAP